MADSRASHTASHTALLLTPQGWAFLGSLPPYDPDRALELAQRLRREGHSPALVAAALTQQRLRARAAAKFGPFAASMLFTPDALEQATRLEVAARHAARYAAAGAQRVADLGCGIGGDAIALAGLDLPVLAIERDEATAALATVNLMHFPHAEVRCADALEVDLEEAGVDAVFADPARRAQGRRITDPEQWSPPLSRVLALRERVPALGVKVAPGIDHGLLPPQAHVQWVSVDGQLVEAAIWCGPLAVEGSGRSALLLQSQPSGEVRASTLSDPAVEDPSQPPEQADCLDSPEGLAELIHEPDGAAIRAGLVSHLAKALRARPVAPRLAYLTGDSAPEAPLAPFLRSWRVTEVLPLRLKALRARVRERGIGRLEIRKRGVEVSPEALRASLRLSGEAGETWILTRLGPEARGAVIVAEPLEPAQAAAQPAP
ncbi:class I SAM-dependent methyltransferase [Actinomyces bowdenii]|uniref:SAM-dependent methyltransferase n=1 Tax=Actinomyces bowdenii TaxID=131109 RepID=A0A3P1VAN1_9ACTO|nr:class I SAM-dependent methyltransferase [Actinomyces bowdenii]RRD30686.1 SAM-dependent methyltransferase [Actinomyces bowdenii]